MVGTDLDRTAQDPDATQVDVSRRAHIVQLQVAERREAIVIGVVVMPSKASSVRKDSDGSERVVAVNDVTANVTNLSDSAQSTHLMERDGEVEDNSRQVYHGFATLVLWDRQFRRGVVHHKNAMRPIGKMLLDPRSVFVLHTGDNDLDRTQRIGGSSAGNLGTPAISGLCDEQHRSTYHQGDDREPDRPKAATNHGHFEHAILAARYRQRRKGQGEE